MENEEADTELAQLIQTIKASLSCLRHCHWAGSLDVARDKRNKRFVRYRGFVSLACSALTGFGDGHGKGAIRACCYLLLLTCLISRLTYLTEVHGREGHPSQSQGKGVGETSIERYVLAVVQASSSRASSTWKGGGLAHDPCPPLAAKAGVLKPPMSCRAALGP